VSRKHNTKHNRKRSNYPKRLRARGLSKTPRMPKVESLREKQTKVEEVNNATEHEKEEAEVTA
jgi:hypothetical protein